MGKGMRKRVLWHMRTTKVQISLRICAVWSAPLFFAAYIVWYVILLTLICYIQSFKVLASSCTWAAWFESYLVENPRRHIFAWCGSCTKLFQHISDGYVRGCVSCSQCLLYFNRREQSSIWGCNIMRYSISPKVKTLHCTSKLLVICM